MEEKQALVLGTGCASMALAQNSEGSDVDRASLRELPADLVGEEATKQLAQINDSITSLHAYDSELENASKEDRLVLQLQIYMLRKQIMDEIHQLADVLMELILTRIDYLKTQVRESPDDAAVAKKMSAAQVSLETNTTSLLTLDNQLIVVPNSKIWGDVIKNVTAQKERRVDMVFGFSYSDDIPKAEAILEDILKSHDKVLDDPQPIVRLHTLGASSVDFVVRPWVKVDDYRDVYWDVTRTVKLPFDEEGVSIPFPQRDVHIHT